MNANKWGLSEKGFYRPNQDEIKKVLDQKTKEAFGANVNLNYKSPNGILNGIFSWFFAKIWEVAEKVYHSSQPTQAEGTQLDYLTIFFGTQRRRPQYAQGTLKIVGTPNYVVPFGRMFERDDKVKFILMNDVILDSSGVGYGDVTSISPGVLGNSDVNTIINQGEPDSDITEVTNEHEVIGGVEPESDAELRKRLSNSYSAYGSGTLNAIYADLLEVPSLRAVKIGINEQDTPKNGIPAHSIAVYTYGGDEMAIGEALMKNYVGIQYFGLTTVQIEDISGKKHDISFTKAVVTNVGFNVEVTLDHTFSGNSNTIKDAIIGVVGGYDSGSNVHNGLNMGEDVVFAQIISAVMNIQGVSNVKLLLGEVGNTYEAKDLEIDETKVANTSINDISVVLK